MCGKCDYCVFLVSGVMPRQRQAWGFLVNTDCRMPNNAIVVLDPENWNTFRGLST